MRQIKDKGNIVSQLNSKVANMIAKLLGQRVNYILRYFSNRHRLPNFRNPKDLSERILSSMLSKDFLRFADFADKIKVRKYVSSKGLGHILLRQYGNWRCPEEIQWDSLPEKFILKANNGSGGHIICLDRSQLDITSSIELLKGILNVEDLKIVEPHYGAIEPRILCEELLGDGNVLPVDYKFTCVQGKIVDIFVVLS